MSVLVERDNEIWTVVIDRPAVKNAVDRRTAAELADAFRAFEADPGAHAAVLTGAGGTFSAGADLRAIAAGEPNRVEEEGDGPLGPTRMALKKPVIAAVAGYAVAGGLELALWCDLRVVEEDAVFGVFCRRFGVPLIDGGTIRLPRLIGLSRALDLILTGRPVGASEALQIGLANRVVAKGESRRAAEALAREIGALPQACLRADRWSAHTQWDLRLEEAMRHEIQGGLGALAEEGLEGASRFMRGRGQARPPGLTPERIGEADANPPLCNACSSAVDHCGVPPSDQDQTKIASPG